MQNNQMARRQANQFGRLAKVEFPKFQGDDIMGWVFKCEQFFLIDTTPEMEKVKIDSAHLFDKALLWHRQFLKTNGENVGWGVYKKAIIKRFGSLFDDHISALTMKRKNKPVIASNGGRYGGRVSYGNNTKASFLALPAPNKGWKPKPNTYVNALKYTPGYKCIGQFYSLVVLADEVDEYFEVEEGNEELTVQDEIPQISLNALNGSNTFQTMRITGKVGKHELHILVDYISTHNFLDVNVAKQDRIREHDKLAGSYDLDPILRSRSCKDKNDPRWDRDLDSLGFGNSMATLGDIKCNFSQLRMKFMTKGKKASVPELNKVVEAFEDVFALPTELPPQRSHDYRIPLLPNVQPVNIRPYRHPPMQKDAIEVRVKELLDSGVIKPSNSPFAFFIVMVKKKDNTWKMCVDYKQLNKNTIKENFPIPIIEELIEELHGTTIFSKLDLRSGYHQIRMHKDDIAKTAFKTHQVYSRSAEEHVKHLTTIILAMRHNKLFAKKSKCVFGTSHVEYLGHVIAAKGVATNPSKKGWYKWSDEAHLAFETLKVAMMKVPVLALPDFTQPFVVETNASVLLELDKWRGYLLDRHFIIKINHFSLKYLLDQRITTPTQMKWLPKLMGFDYEVTYKKGSENGTTDALSRVQTTELFSLVTTLITTDLAKKIKYSWLEDEKLQSIITKLKVWQSGKKHYVWSNNQLLRKGKIMVG
ncbi:reverse transcriptase [Tanacetum coccineum]